LIHNQYYRHHLVLLLLKRTRLSNSFKATYPTFLLLFSFFVSSLLLSPALAAQTNTCSSRSFDERALVVRVYDGDTVKLANGDSIRLIGINTPEMNYDTGTPEPYAKKAKRFLEKLVLKNKIGIKYGAEKTDRYKRKLAHIFLLDGTNLQYEILKSGLAFNISIPPNLRRHNCYFNAEKTARNNNLGIWKSPHYKPVKASKINKNQLGFKLITGKVNSVLKTKKSIRIKFSEKMALRINKKDLHYFKNLQPEQLIGKHITARGWVNLYKHRFSMRIRHPDAMSVN